MWVRKARGLAIILWVVTFVILSTSLTWFWARALELAHADALVAAGWMMLVPTFMLDIGIFAALYKLTPTVRVNILPAVLAGIVGAVLWELSKFFFTWWVIEVGTYNRVYGPLAASVIVMLWLWISAMTFLYGAELCVVLQRRPLSGDSTRQ
jgi:membrane protein